MALPVIFTPDANEQLKTAAAWWRANRLAAPELLEYELRRALVRIAMHPGIGARITNERLERARCVLLPRTRYQLYYRLRPDESAIDVIAFWHAERGARP